jgi:type II secretory pathway pseudopilin PulG
MVSSAKEHIYMNLQGQGEVESGQRCQAGHRLAREDGYAMAALLVTIAVMGILMSVAMPTWRHQARREKEAELIWRAGQYVHAIELYKRKFANAYPTNIDVLVKGRFLRKKYLDPMTKNGDKEGDFRLISPQELNGTPTRILQPGGQNQGPGRNSGPGSGSGFGSSRESGSGFGTAGGADNRLGSGTAMTGSGLGSSTGGAPGNIDPQKDSNTTSGPGGTIQVGPIAAVASRSTDQSIRIFKGRDHYNQWIVTIDDVVPRQFLRQTGTNPNQQNQPQSPTRPTNPTMPTSPSR